MTKSITTGPKDIAVDLNWMDLLKGIAIIGVFFDNWTIYFDIHFPGWGPFVQVFFILSGFGLTIAYLKRKGNQSWGKWTWRRFTKVVIPYIIAVLFSFALGVMGSQLYVSLDKQFSWTELFAYLTFTRNFYPPSWGWNHPLWFMPVIIGLYISFPVLINIKEKWGTKGLLLVSLLVTYGTLTFAFLTGTFRGHPSDLFTFWIIQFALGMVLAYIRHSQPQKMRHLIGLRAFLIGLALFTFSWGLRTYAPGGRQYNDLFTSVGIFLILLNFIWLSRLLFPVTEKILSNLGKKSYLMYLIHYPIISFLIGPPLLGFINNSIVGTIIGGIYIAVMFFLSSFISPSMDKFTSWVYDQLYPAYQPSNQRLSNS